MALEDSSFRNDGGWLLRFFDSAFFCEWIAVTYLYRHEIGGVRDYLCNRMYTLPLNGVEEYLCQLCHLAAHKPSPSLEKYLIDSCSNSLRVCLKVYWFLQAEIEENEAEDDIVELQEKCLNAAIDSKWPPLVCPRPPTFELSGTGRMLRLVSSASKRLLPMVTPTSERDDSGQTDGIGEAVAVADLEWFLNLLRKVAPGTKVQQMTDAILKRLKEVATREGDRVDKSKLVSEAKAISAGHAKLTEQILNYFKKDSSGSVKDSLALQASSASVSDSEVQGNASTAASMEDSKQGSPSKGVVSPSLVPASSPTPAPVACDQVVVAAMEEGVVGERKHDGGGKDLSITDKIFGMVRKEKHGKQGSAEAVATLSDSHPSEHGMEVVGHEATARKHAGKEGFVRALFAGKSHEAAAGKGMADKGSSDGGKESGDTDTCSHGESREALASVAAAEENDEPGGTEGQGKDGVIIGTPPFKDEGQEGPHGAGVGSGGMAAWRMGPFKLMKDRFDLQHSASPAAGRVNHVSGGSSGDRGSLFGKLIHRNRSENESDGDRRPVHADRHDSLSAETLLEEGSAPDCRSGHSSATPTAEQGTFLSKLRNSIPPLPFGAMASSTPEAGGAEQVAAGTVHGEGDGSWEGHVQEGMEAHKEESGSLLLKMSLFRIDSGKKYSKLNVDTSPPHREEEHVEDSACMTPALNVDSSPSVFKLGPSSPAQFFKKFRKEGEAVETGSTAEKAVGQQVDGHSLQSPHLGPAGGSGRLASIVQSWRGSLGRHVSPTIESKAASLEESLEHLQLDEGEGEDMCVAVVQPSAPVVEGEPSEPVRGTESDSKPAPPPQSQHKLFSPIFSFNRGTPAEGNMDDIELAGGHSSSRAAGSWGRQLGAKVAHGLKMPLVNFPAFKMPGSGPGVAEEDSGKKQELEVEAEEEEWHPSSGDHASLEVVSGSSDLIDWLIQADKPSMPRHPAFIIRKTTFHASLDFTKALCDISQGLVDVFPLQHRQEALRESLSELNAHLEACSPQDGVCLPMGKSLFRLVHILEKEALLLNSRERVPFMLFVEVLNCEPAKDKEKTPVRQTKRMGIPLASSHAQLPRPPPWALHMWKRRQQQSHLASTSGLLGPTGPSRVVELSLQVRKGRRRPAWHQGNLESVAHPDMGREREEERQRVGCGDREAGSTPSKTNSGSSNGSSGSSSLRMWESDAFGLSHAKSVELGREDDCMSDTSMSDTFSLFDASEQTGPDSSWVTVKLVAVPGVTMNDVAAMVDGRKQHMRVPSMQALAQVQEAANKGDVPAAVFPEKPHASADTQKLEGENVFGIQLWEERKSRVRKTSKFASSPDWDMKSFIVKSGDDCRQEHLAVQLVSHLQDIFEEAGLPLWLRPYEVIVTSSNNALIETIPDAVSLHSLKQRNPQLTSLREHFCQMYGEGSPAFRNAQQKFVESLAGYSIFSYLLQVKDRHNGNIMIDTEGHLIHIDFGFMLSNSPGGVNFENAPFKLTREFLEVMDSTADGAPSEAFDYFKVLCIQGFLTVRKHSERIILMVEMMQNSGCKCFRGGKKTINNLRRRFHLTYTEEQCVSTVLSLISDSMDAWRTRQYDYFQRILNGIL